MVTDASRTAALRLAEERFQAHAALRPRSFLALDGISSGEAGALLRRGLEMKAAPAKFADVLKGKAIALLFQKTSTRTRCSFERAADELGAVASYIDWGTSNFVRGEIRDEIKTLSRYYDAIVARVMANETLQAMADASEVPVINGLCDLRHPCQALADYLTLAEFFGPDLAGLTIAWVGDGNNVCHSLVAGAEKFGAKVVLCSPDGYALQGESGTHFRVVANPFEAVRHADAIYTDTWVSMGSEAEEAQRVRDFAPYQVNERLLDAAPAHALVMHCLPAHPGQEITAGVLRGPRSLAFEQAENRKHAQKAVLEWLITGEQGA